MRDGWLTVRLVEDMQYMLHAGRPIDAIVSGLRSATLPAIIQYRSLAWTGEKKVPDLPRAIMQSNVGRALASFEGLLCTKSGFRPARTVRAHTAESFALSTQDDLVSEAWELFEVRFNRSAQRAGLSRSIADLLQVALHEMVDNAISHSYADLLIISAYHALDGFVQFCVADTGIGVYESLRTCPEHARITTDSEAIRRAITDGVSRFGRGNGGWGFRQVFKAVASQWGFLRFRSGEGCVSIDGKDCDSDKGTQLFLSPLRGFHVTISCLTTPGAIAQPIA